MRRSLGDVLRSGDAEAVLPREVLCKFTGGQLTRQDVVVEQVVEADEKLEPVGEKDVAQRIELVMVVLHENSTQ